MLSSCFRPLFLFIKFKDDTCCHNICKPWRAPHDHRRRCPPAAGPQPYPLHPFHAAPSSLAAPKPMARVYSKAYRSDAMTSLARVYAGEQPNGPPPPARPFLTLLPGPAPMQTPT